MSGSGLSASGGGNVLNVMTIQPPTLNKGQDTVSILTSYLLNNTSKVDSSETRNTGIKTAVTGFKFDS